MELLHQTKSDVLRTFLSLSGVSIGIFVVTVSFALVDAFSRSVVAGFDHFGSDMIMVERFPVISDGGSDWSRYAIRPQPSADDYMVLSGGFNCKWTAFAGASGADIVYGGKALRDCKMVGVQGAWQHLVYSGVCAGRAFSLAELSGSEAKAILGAGIVRELFGVDVRTAAAEACQAVCGRTVRLDGRNMTVIGVLSYEGKNIINLYATDFAVIVPFATAERIAGRDNLETMVAVGPKADLRDAATEEMRRILRASRHLKPGQEDNFALNTMEDLCRQTVALTSKITSVGLLVALFSLLIGGFGIVNIMLVSVKERTFEIGLKKALGAKRKRILLEFLAEALILSVAGTALGLLLAWGALSLIPSGVLDARFTEGHIFLAFGVAAVLGLASGVVPAAQASRLNPVEALRSR